MVSSFPSQVRALFLSLADSSFLCFQISSSSSSSSSIAREKRRGTTMGRAKLEIKYRENSRARLATYLTRMKGLKKKSSELSLLCGVDVFLASYSPDFNTVQFWPEQDTPEFRRIRERYCHFRSKSEKMGDCSDERNYCYNENMPCVPMPSSSSFLSILEEWAAMKLKQQEVRERLRFLRSFSSDATSKDQPLQVMVSSQPLEEQLTVPPAFPFLEQPVPFRQPHPAQPHPALADFTVEDWSWCDSLVNYDK